MVNVIHIPAKYKDKLLTAIESIGDKYPELKSQLAEFNAAISLKEDEKIDDSHILSENRFDHFRQNLLRVINPLNTVSKPSQQLWLLLKYMARIHPLNQTDIISLAPVPQATESAGGWFFASSGHAFKLVDVITFQYDDKFYNPFISSTTPFNHHDQVAIRKKAETASVPIPNPKEDARKFITNLNRRAILAGANLFRDIFTEGPAIFAAIKRNIFQRSRLSGLDEFLAYLLSQEFGIYWLTLNITPFICYCFLEDTPVNSIFNLLTITTVILLSTCAITNVLEKLFTLMDFPIFVFLSLVHACNLGLLQAKNHINPDSQLTFILTISKSILPTRKIIDLFSELISTLNHYFPGNFVLLCSEKLLNSITIIAIKMLKIKSQYEIKKFTKTPEGKKAKRLLTTGVQLITNFQEELEQGMTRDVREYMTSLYQQISEIGLQQMRGVNPVQLIQQLRQLFNQQADGNDSDIQRMTAMLRSSFGV